MNITAWLRSCLVSLLPTSVMTTSENFLFVPFALAPQTIDFSILGWEDSTETSFSISASVKPIVFTVITFVILSYTPPLPLSRWRNSVLSYRAFLVHQEWSGIVVVLNLLQRLDSRLIELTLYYVNIVIALYYGINSGVAHRMLHLYVFSKASRTAKKIVLSFINKTVYHFCFIDISKIPFP